MSQGSAHIRDRLPVSASFTVPTFLTLREESGEVNEGQSCEFRQTGPSQGPSPQRRRPVEARQPCHRAQSGTEPGVSATDSSPPLRRHAARAAGLELVNTQPTCRIHEHVDLAGLSEKDRPVDFACRRSFDSTMNNNGQTCQPALSPYLTAQLAPVHPWLRP